MPALRDSSAPQLPVATRARGVREAAGDPLALLELPAAVGRDLGEQWVPGGSPLTERLERAFAARVSDLPPATRLVVLATALSDDDNLNEILEASSALSGSALELDDAGPAVEAGIVEAVHEALANTLEDQPDRGAWHRAALPRGEHEDIARTGPLDRDSPLCYR